jgi:hypothetical protein
MVVDLCLDFLILLYLSFANKLDKGIKKSSM